MADDMIDSLRIFSNITPDTDAAALTQWAADEIERLRSAIDVLVGALDVEGRCPPHHQAVMAKHRYEWPVMWRAIDGLREARRG